MIYNEFETLLDRDLNIDKSLLPKKLLEMSEQLEAYDQAGDWAHYAMLCEDFEITVKYSYMNKKISGKMFELLNKKYCGYE